jgi:hypothetical protein
MPSKKKNPDKGKKLLEETKKRIRLEQEARTQARLEHPFSPTLRTKKRAPLPITF